MVQGKSGLLNQLFFVGTVFACHPVSHHYPAPETYVVQGHLRGTWFSTRGGRKVAGFLGIPYAAPPVGRLRFMNPQNPNPWEGLYDASSEGPACIQRSVVAHLPLLPDTYGSEDCLYLNVFTPNIAKNGKLPVVVFIHGGYFEVGFSKTFLYGPQYLLDEDIILVSLNYRLGILGFLSLHDPALPDNLGLKDQRMALRWVQNNIGQFGGDSSKVTLFGESAGAASVHYHMMFTAGEGLFRAGICNSGSALAPWALHTSQSLRPLVELLVKETGCPRTPVHLIPCLRELPAQEFPRLLHLVRENGSRLIQRVTVVGPVVEIPDTDSALITADPWNISSATHLPLLTGANQMEGIYWLVDTERDKTDNLFEEFNENYKHILPYTLHFDYSTHNSSELARVLKKFYFKSNNINRKNFNHLVELFSDGLFNYNLLEAVKRNTPKSYLYQMNYHGSNSVVHYLGMKGYGVSHFDEMFYLFPIGGPLIRNETEEDTAVSKELIKLWTNFIKYSDPTPDSSPVKWQPVISSFMNFLNIGQHGFKMDSHFLKDRMEFWESIFTQSKLEYNKLL